METRNNRIERKEKKDTQRRSFDESSMKIIKYETHKKTKNKNDNDGSNEKIK